ncbi:unnamed protein product, partial [Mesorhabditis spiculigera]
MLATRRSAPTTWDPLERSGVTFNAQLSLARRSCSSAPRPVHYKEEVSTAWAPTTPRMTRGKSNEDASNSMRAGSSAAITDKPKRIADGGNGYENLS